MVGPRPAIPSEVEQYDDRQRARLLVLPGLTGLWQISGRSDLPFDKSIELDLEYIASQSWWQYMRILILTIPAVVQARGAY
jgi:lipopolysaccharide/colanic/teichoic acid biosynthesis glycosyltransferase